MAALLAGGAVALASDASYEQQQARNQSAASQGAGAKSEAPQPPVTTCGCPHGRS